MKLLPVVVLHLACELKLTDLIFIELKSNVNCEIFAALKVGEFAFFSINGRQNFAFAAEI
jgi:hypothetical protein